jgi:hypothetical protein
VPSSPPLVDLRHPHHPGDAEHESHRQARQHQAEEGGGDHVPNVRLLARPQGCVEAEDEADAWPEH